MITGYFRNIIIFTLIILVHELGHFLIARLFNWNIDKIYIYPFGGCIKFDDKINKPLIEELFILLFGPFIQIIFFLVFKNLFTGNSLILFESYNYSILLFNMLPIYPLDGGRLFNIVLNYFISFKKSLYVTFFISSIFIIIIILLSNGLIFYLVMLLLLIKLIEEIKKINYYFNKFLLERYLYDFNFKKVIVIKSVKNMMRDKRHTIKYNGFYRTEKEVVSKHYK